jgi:2-dehydropantoate 2-reductase
MSEKPTIGILGPGAVGGFLAAALWKSGFSVTCIAKEATVGRIQTEGITIESTTHGTWTAYPAVTPVLSQPVDVLFVTPKAMHLAAALERVPPESLSPSTIIVPLLNGIEHMALLRERYGRQVAAATVRIEAKYVTPVLFQHTSSFAIIQWASGDVPAEKLDALGAILMETPGLKVERKATESLVLFDKFIRLTALASTTAAFNAPIGVVRTTPAMREALEGAVREGVAVAQAEGLPFTTESILAFIDGLPESLGTSMQRDLHAGKPTEVDHITGALVRLAHRHGLDAPTLTSLMEAIQRQELAYQASTHALASAAKE